MEGIGIRITLRRDRSGGEWEHGAITAGHPALGETEGEDKDVAFLEHAPDSSEVRCAFGQQLFDGGETASLNAWPEWVDEPPVSPVPRGVAGGKP